MTFLIYIIAIILTVFIVVGVHEFGHFIVARLLGIKVLRFSIGFGKTLYHWYDKKGTEYVIAAIPLGGYVKMLDEEDGKVAPDELKVAFNRQPVYKKLAVIAAGPFINIILAFFLYWLIFIIGFNSVIPIIGSTLPNSVAAEAKLKPNEEIISIDDTPTNSWMAVVMRLINRSGDKGQLVIKTKNLANLKINTYQLELSNWKMDDLKPDPLESLGITPYQPKIPLIIGKLKSETNTLRIGDRILALNHKPITDWVELAKEIDVSPDKFINLTILRENKKHTFRLKVDYKRDWRFKKHGYLGIGPDFKWPESYLRQNKYGPLYAAIHAWQNTVDFTHLNLIVLGKLVTGKLSLQSLGGPITIFDSAGNALNAGFIYFFNFLAFLSISIGIINILPIPGLDGGHVFVLLLGLVRGKPLSINAQVFLYRIGFIAIILLITQSLINDFLRLIYS